MTTWEMILSHKYDKARECGLSRFCSSIIIFRSVWPKQSTGSSYSIVFSLACYGHVHLVGVGNLPKHLRSLLGLRQSQAGWNKAFSPWMLAKPDITWLVKGNMGHSNINMHPLLGFGRFTLYIYIYVLMFYAVFHEPSQTWQMQRLQTCLCLRV